MSIDRPHYSVRADQRNLAEAHLIGAHLGLAIGRDPQRLNRFSGVRAQIHAPIMPRADGVVAIGKLPIVIVGRKVV